VAQRSHFAALDGIRGIAAISVVLFHLGHWLNVPALATNSGLAVDLFFCLSGYVLCVAYQDRLAQGMPALKFVRIRLIRLWPLIALGTVISFVFVVSRLAVKQQALGWDVLVLAPVLGTLSLPFFNAPKMIGGPQVFPLNGPQYTLFLELLVNLAWAVQRRSKQGWMTALLVVSALAGILIFGLGGDQTSNFWSGIPRVFGSYFLGVTIYFVQCRVMTTSQNGLFYLGVLLMLILFYIPVVLPLYISMVWIAGIAPVLVFTGARATLPAHWSAAALLGGRLSYPIYALHYPIFCWVNGTFQTVFKHRNVALEIPICFVAIVLGSYIALVVFDEPIRRFLTRSRNGGDPAPEAAAATGQTG
jgi:peptidoglycan/LPS O-acetylase OafA/YrhL